MSSNPQSGVDHYLSRIARQAWPNASVSVHPEPNGSKYFQLEVPGEKPFILGNVFGAARAMLRAIVYEHLPPDANRAAFTFEMRVIDDAKRPGPADMALATQIGASLAEKSSSRADAILAGKLLALGAGGSAFTLGDVYALRKLGAERGKETDDYQQVAKAIARWCDFED
jgi:hypothetical protein